MDTKGNLPAFLAQNRVEYRILMGDVATARAYGGVSTIPTTFFVGKDGIIKNVHIGYLDKDTFEQEVRKLLELRGSGSSRAVSPQGARISQWCSLRRERQGSNPEPARTKTRSHYRLS
jgi:hypothetical protein